jgi:cell division protein FtsI/penicillin-binding protein 2
MDKIGAKKGSAMVIDPRNGKIMAMANLPSYNPEDLNSVGDVALFNNDIISAPYEPGSIIKTFMVSTGIDKGAITPQSTYVNTDYIQVEDRTISNATKGQTGTITFQHALNWSLNTGMVTIAQRLGDGTINRNARDTMYDYYHNRFGLDKLTGVELAGEVPGVIISPDKTEGNAVRYSNMSFGQGLDLTMLEVGASFCSVVNGGNYYQPTILDGILGADGKITKTEPKLVRQTISPTTSSTVKDMLQIARSGTFLKADKPGYKVGGKTGTSQVIVNGEYSDSQTVASYVGYGGADEARYVIIVQVSGDGEIFGGSKDAGPIFTDISNWMLGYLRIQPKE